MAVLIRGSRSGARGNGVTRRWGHAAAKTASAPSTRAQSAAETDSRAGRERSSQPRRLGASLGLVLSLLAQPGAGLGDVAGGIARLVTPPIGRAIQSLGQHVAPALGRGAAFAAPAAVGLFAQATNVHAQTVPTATWTVVPFNSPGWKYRNVAYGGDPGFQQPTYNDSTWATGTAGFGIIGNCPLNDSSHVHTAWPEVTEMLLRKRFDLPSDATSVSVLVPIDDSVQVWLNGTDISNGMRSSTLCAQVPPNVGNPGYFQFNVPSSLLQSRSNLIAVRAHDVDGGGNLDFVDVQITATIPTRPAPTGMKFEDISAAGFASEPVNTRTGDFGYSHTDIALSGRGPSPTFARTYNSLDVRTGPLGPGWTHTYNVRLDAPGDPNAPNDLLLVHADGRSDRYTFNSSTQTFSPPAGVFTTLVRNADGSFTTLNTDQSSLGFNSVGQLTSMTDRYGNVSTITYGSNGQVASVSDPAGRGVLSLAYDTCASGRLCSVTDWAGRVVTFTYDASGRLATVQDRQNDASHRTTYGYDGASQRILTITDPNGHIALVNSYDSTTGKVTSQKDALNNVTSFTYNGPSTTVTLPANSFDGKQMATVDTYDGLGRVIQRTSAPSNVGGETTTQSLTYDAN